MKRLLSLALLSMAVIAGAQPYYYPQPVYHYPPVYSPSPYYHSAPVFSPPSYYVPSTPVYSSYPSYPAHTYYGGGYYAAQVGGTTNYYNASVGGVPGTMGMHGTFYPGVATRTSTIYTSGGD